MMIKRIYSSLVFASLCTIAFTANAGPEYKSYSGANCAAKRIGDNLARNTAMGNIYNKDSGSRQVLCPITRDLFGNASTVKAIVKVSNRHENSKFYCYLHAKNANGGSVTYAYDTTNGSGNDTLTLGPIQTSSDGFYFIRCSIPGKYNNYSSYLTSYKIIETN